MHSLCKEAFPRVYNPRCHFFLIFTRTAFDHVSLGPPSTSPSKLGRYRILSPNAGVRVSPLQLGAMSIGDKWSAMGTMDKASSFKLLDAFYDAGGNFIDTANNYQNEASEQFIGEWMENRGIRDQLVIATKYSTNYKHGDASIPIKMGYAGNGHKSLHLSVEASLKKLRTTYIDILYVHWWAFDTSVEEVMNNLHNLVVAGKVLYLGVSDTPAWIVAKANQWAKCHGKTPFCVYQGKWSILERSFERDIIPMAKSEGLALAPWGVVGQGRLRTDEEERRRKESGEGGRTTTSSQWERTPDEVKVSHKLEEIAKEVGTKHITAVAIAYVMHKAPHVFPIVGGRKVEHLEANMEALDIKLTPAQIKAMEEVLPFDQGFPNSMVGDGTHDPWLVTIAGNTDRWPAAPPLNP
ncbi:Aldo/keto reductase [Gautieria morchelliformis]|nr:Aldo/keto reductase [Gautieria morchelliformis]